LLQSEEALLDLVDFLPVGLVLLGQLEVVPLLVYVLAALHQKLLGQPHRGLVRVGLLEVQAEVKEVSELIVLEDVQQGMAFLLSRQVLHYAQESVRAVFVFSVGYAKI
jgi:hypothetical protein